MTPIRRNPLRSVSTVERDTASEHEVTPLELFFDLVLVFAITKVTTLITHHPSWGRSAWNARPGGGLVGMDGVRARRS
jgi:Bacterial low temperature requirement A protein (LtrA)